MAPIKNMFQDRAQGRGQRVSGDAEVPLVPRAGDLRPGDVRAAAGAQGDVGGQDGEEQDHQLRARVRSVTIIITTLQLSLCRVRVTISCRMVFDDYPLDDHSCQFQVGSCKCDARLSHSRYNANTPQTTTRSRRSPAGHTIFMTRWAALSCCTLHSPPGLLQERQRSLQHFIQIEDLPPHFAIVDLPSGSY